MKDNINIIKMKREDKQITTVNIWRRSKWKLEWKDKEVKERRSIIPPERESKGRNDNERW